MGGTAGIIPTQIGSQGRERALSLHPDWEHKGGTPKTFTFYDVGNARGPGRQRLSLLCHPHAYSQADPAVSVATEAGHPSPSPNKPGLQPDGLTRGVGRSLRGSLPTKVSRGSGPNIHRGRSSLTSSFIFESAPPRVPLQLPLVVTTRTTQMSNLRNNPVTCQ